jgi:hypothetical protein
MSRDLSILGRSGQTGAYASWNFADSWSNMRRSEQELKVVDAAMRPAHSTTRETFAAKTPCFYVPFQTYHIQRWSEHMTHSLAPHRPELLDKPDLQQPEVYSLSDMHPHPIPWHNYDNSPFTGMQDYTRRAVDRSTTSSFVGLQRS